ncbi:hypothetical protein Mgra_00004972 [Meloidogyne graminicola]|uniref:Uncharacterized protein n=1 Tax=Meloidogyne graminicola TaxID=189291 RepID=A0A8S9ZQT6_9BILA|nr:hypothetical protein Mgra_00004972 [Meloidogyne graminicola]
MLFLCKDNVSTSSAKLETFKLTADSPTSAVLTKSDNLLAYSKIDSPGA